MIAGLALAAALGVAPAVRAGPGVPPEAAAAAAEAWASQERLLAAEGVPPPPAPRPLQLARVEALAGAAAAESRPGLVALRPGVRLDGPAARAGPGAAALRHEVAHQLLFEACPAASDDRLFHEAFAVAVSGELAGWAAAEDGRYLPLARALEALGTAPGGRPRSLDTPAARRALARLLAEAPAPAGRLPRALAVRLGRCEAGARWDPMRPEELAAAADAADALVVLSRHSGEVLRAEGAAGLPLPFGSTLKPFLVAGAGDVPPALPPDPSSPGWRCGALPPAMRWETALLRSCNGWFLAWAGRSPEVVRLGAWGPPLLALGLSALPADAGEAIGVRPSLRLSPLGLAHAYRLLAEARPDLVAVLARNAREGTLSGLPASPALAGVAAKTGTVLDAAARPRLGWIAAVDRDLVVVMARAGRPPRTFAGELAAALAAARAPAAGAARVQVFGLLPEAPAARCAGVAVAAGPGGPRLLPEGEAGLRALAAAGPLLCAGGPWLVRVPGRAEPRAYAGVFTLEPVPAGPAGPDHAGPPPTAREARARRGSDLVFRTTRLRYAAGVVAAEDAAARGPARVALARVADANAVGGHARHGGRPVCDTTHCQAFLGTPAPGREERAALAAPLRAAGWLLFSRGGGEPWTAARPRAAVEAALLPGARALAFGGGEVSFLARAGDGEAAWEERRRWPCEALRGPLKLPACPDRAEDGDPVRFEGHGEGHGQGLDLTAARASGRSAEQILERAYGGLIVPGGR